MRKSIVLEKLRCGETVFCLKSLYADPDLCELLGRLGCEVIWICNEHIAIDPSRMREVIRAGRAGNVDIMIRRTFGNYDDLIQPLEMGAAGLMIPHCRDAAMARAIVREVRFHPLGNRGIDGISADSGFGLHPLTEYIKFANRETFLMLQIEDVEAIDEIEAIAAVEGVDIIFIGPADLSQSLGVPGEVKHPRIRETIERAVKACRRQGKWCGTAGIDPDYARELIANGVNFVTVTSDYRILREGVKNTLTEYNRLLN